MSEEPVPSKVPDPVVTVMVERHVKPGSEDAYEELLRGLLAAVATFRGYLGVNVMKPSHRADTLYRVVLRFDNEENLRRWTESAERQKWLRCLAAVTVGEPDIRIMTGLETWFATRPQAAIIPPPRYKMALMALLASYPLVTLILALLAPSLAHWPLALRTLLMSVTIVLLMTYVIMPLLVRASRRWLFPDPYGAHGSAGKD